MAAIGFDGRFDIFIEQLFDLGLGICIAGSRSSYVFCGLALGE